MREIEAQATKTQSRAFKPWASAAAAVLVLIQGACGGHVTGPSATAEPLDRLSLSGTWRGGSANESLVWHLNQEGNAVTGSGFIADGSRWTGDGGNVVGTLSGSNFSFRESHAVGTTSVPGCSVEVEGVLQVSPIQVGPTSGPPNAPPYPLGNYQPPTITKTKMSGRVSGRTCGGDLNTMVTLIKD